ncbi:hypothetical protein ASG33_20890 [Dyadobacter sp. Leaf189]|nr:hypothetical protein ASG33_20890 [Dyadobacter sp. Leaf189]
MALSLAAFNGSDRNAAPDFSKIKGRFVLNEASCAGFEFFSDKEVIWRNEITCQDPDTLLIHWLDDKSFLMKDKQPLNGAKNCPPRNWYYVVTQFDGKNLVLQELWTGWGEYRKENLKLTRKGK